MAGYSTTSLSKKLGIKPGHRVAAVNAPRSADSTIALMAAESPVELRLARGAQAGRVYNVIVVFCSSFKDLENTFAPAAAALDEEGGLWVAWPKKTSGLQTDLNENDAREYGLSQGLVDNKVCAIDETWSGLRFVVRVKDRQKKSAGAKRQSAKTKPGSRAPRLRRP
jgi:hypothetical protein